MKAAQSLRVWHRAGETLTLATGNKKTPARPLPPPPVGRVRRSPTNTSTRANCEPRRHLGQKPGEISHLCRRRHCTLMKPVGIIPELAHSLNASKGGREGCANASENLD